MAEFRANKLPEITKRRNIRPLGHAAKMGLLDDYTRRAKYKGRAFALSPAQFFAITKMDCHYCGVGPQQVARGGASGSNGIYLYNGIDRVDSSAGYTLENTVPACGLCNKAKRDLTYLEFREWLERIVSYNERQAY